MNDASDMILLARLQFAFTIASHILFPAFVIGLASYLATLKALWLRTRLQYPDVDWSRLLPLAPIPLLVALAFGGLFRALRRGAAHAPYLWSILLFLLGYVGLIVGIWPHLVPYAITFRAAAAAPAAQAFLLAGTLVLLPLILGYTAYAYWTFRGKVGDRDGYH
ncbi:MAG: cytochrome d ubiquinol oxidase subunit II [Gammaproteobacteria bacterium]|jgi:cytochrome d ubiquinol oxidase subunit II